MDKEHFGLDKVVYDFFGKQEYSTKVISSGQVNNNYLVQFNGEKFVVRETSKPERNIVFESEIIKRLREKKFPTPRLLRTTKNKRFSYNNENKKKYQAFSYVEGKVLDDNEVADHLLLTIGESLGNMHNALENFMPKEKPLFEGFGHFQNISDRINAIPYIQNEILARFSLEQPKRKAIITLCEKTANEIERDIRRVIKGLPVQPIHGDYTRENILFNSDISEIAGVIDFDDAHMDPRIFDPVIASVYFGTNEREFSTKKVKKIFEGYRYAIATPLQSKEATAIQSLTEMYGLFAVFWTINKFNQSQNFEDLGKVLKYSSILESIRDTNVETWRNLI